MPGHLMRHHQLHHHQVHHHPPHTEIDVGTTAKAATWIFCIGAMFGGPVGGAVALAGAGSIVGAARLISRARSKSDNTFEL